MRDFRACRLPGILLTAFIVSQAAVVEGQQVPEDRPPLVRADAAQRISDHVWVILDEGVRFVPNIGIIVGENATLVIDTGLGHRNGETVVREARKIGANTSLYLATTHFHPEHAGGSSAFPEDAQFVVSREQQQDLDELAVDLAQRFATFSPINAQLLENVRFRRGDVIFEREETIDLGGVGVRLISLGPTHTRGDTVMFVEEDGVAFVGDIVMSHTFLSFNQGSSVQAWLDALDELEALNPVMLVPSHGETGDASLIGEQRRVIAAIVGRVRALQSEGESVEEAAELLVGEFQAAYPGWGAPNRVAAAVRAAWDQTPK